MGSKSVGRVKAKSSFYEPLEQDDITLSLHSSISGTDARNVQAELRGLLHVDDRRSQYQGISLESGRHQTPHNVPNQKLCFTYEQEKGIYKFLGRNLYSWMYPSSLPRPCQLLRLENIGVPASYLFVGFMQGLSGPFMNVYPLDINATEAQQTTILGLQIVPASMKLFFGFLSDTCPLAGYRRKSYMMLGWTVACLAMLALVFFSDLHVTERKEISTKDDGESVKYITRHASEKAPSVGFLSLTLLNFGFGFWCADVMADTMVAEKAKLEPEAYRGKLQSTCYACRFFGRMVASPFSTFAYGRWGPQFVAQIMGLLPLCILPCIYLLDEPYQLAVRRVQDQCLEIWNTVCSRAVWQPMGFVYLYQAMQIGNAAWREYLRSVLKFTANELNSLLVVANVLIFSGIVAYKSCFLHVSWRKVYVACTLVNAVFSFGQIFLILRTTFGMSPFLFALGDDAASDFIAGVQFLPTTIMMVQLCPSGSEGASYAMFTTVSNSAMSLASSFSTQLLSIWDVSKKTIVSGDISGMVKLTILTTALQTFAVSFVGLLPRYKEDLDSLHADGKNTSKVGGFIFLSVALTSIVYAIVVGVLNILCPGWFGGE